MSKLTPSMVDMKIPHPEIRSDGFHVTEVDEEFLELKKNFGASGNRKTSH